MQVWESLIQYFRMSGKELRENIKIIDGGRASQNIEEKIELSNSIFPRKFEDGDCVTFHLKDLTMFRLDKHEHYFGYKAQVFYKKQEIPIIITIGTTYERGTIRNDLKSLERVWNEDFGAYLFYIEKYLPK